MNYTQLYKKANMKKVATTELIYKVATLLKKAEFKKTVKGIVLPEDKTLQQVKDMFYRNISDANKRGRHSNVG